MERPRASQWSKVTRKAPKGEVVAALDLVGERLSGGRDCACSHALDGIVAVSAGRAFCLRSEEVHN